jgi:replicative DNA helicase
MSELIHPTAERIACAGLLRGDAQALELAQVLEPHEFSSVPLQVVVEACKRVLRGIEPVDIPSVYAESKEVIREWKVNAIVTEDLIRGLMQEDTARAEPYSHTVKRMAYLRSAAAFSEWMTQELTMMPDPDELFAAVSERLQALKPKGNATRFVYGWDTLDYEGTLRHREQERKEGTAKVFPWPWHSWADISVLRPGMVGILSGAEGSGKSSYLEMIAESWAQYGNVVFVHLENNQEYTEDRRMARWARIPIAALETETLTTQQRAAVREAGNSIAEFAGNLHYYDASGQTMAEIIRELEARVDEGVCDAVVLDYLNKVRPSRGQVKAYDKGFDRMADDIEQFKTFLEQRRVVGMTAAQMNKRGKAEDGRLDSTAIRGSGELADKAQLIVMLQREVLTSDLRDPTGKLVAKAGEDKPVISVRVEKQNRGRKGVEFEQKYKGQFFLVEDKPV